MALYSQSTIQHYFKAACSTSQVVEVWINHPNTDFQFQGGQVMAANEDYFVIGPVGAPGKVCIPYSAVRWFRCPEET